MNMFFIFQRVDDVLDDGIDDFDVLVELFDEVVVLVFSMLSMYVISLPIRMKKV